MGVYWSGKSQQPRIANETDLQKITGPIGPGILAMLNQRTEERRFGQWPQEDAPNLRRAVLLGAGTRADLLKVAQRAGFDLLVSLEISTRGIGLTGRVETSMRVRLVDVATKTPLWSSTAISSSQLAQAGYNAAVQYVAGIAQQVDDQFCLTSMPPLKPEHVQRRVASLADEFPQPDEALRVLTEIRYYQVNDLLADADAVLVYDRVLGAGKGRPLTEGDASGRRQLLEAWLKGP